MTHKVHPKAFRIKEITDWDTRGYYKNPAKYLEEDFRIREFIKKKWGRVGIEKIEIERFPSKTNIIISSSRPGLIIGRGGEGIDQFKKELWARVLRKKTIPFYIRETGKKISKKKIESDFQNRREIRIEIREVKNPWTSANLSSQWIAQQIEKRVPYRRVLKQALSKIKENKEVQGARIEVSGRLNGVEIARRDWLKEGRLPRQMLRADLDYALNEAHCTYGVIGIKVWIYKGEKFD